MFLELSISKLVALAEARDFAKTVVLVAKQWRDERREQRRERRGRDWNGYGNYGGSFQLRQTALNAGYNNGIKAGRNDQRKNKRFDLLK